MILHKNMKIIKKSSVCSDLFDFWNLIYAYLDNLHLTISLQELKKSSIRTLMI